MLYHRSLNRICNNFSQNFFKKTTRYFVSIKWVDSDGIETVTKAKIGDTLLDNAIKNNIELECACEGSLACSTCHVILDENTFESLPAASDKEDDLLDCAFGLTETSRLGCQVIIDKEMKNVLVKIPSATRNMSVDGYKPPRH
ncbi:hypothetical protein MHBO_000929 [Bonamia ostreae]|uniref:2Fe-2S ferredoxin n=1 Tax=Bonamia ostreae TaxID=126728 RepID=A0ABV2AH94_9EUKA